MTNRKIFLISLFIFFGISAGIWVFTRLKSNRSEAGLKIITDPPIQVSVNGQNLGLSPISTFLSPGEAKVEILSTPSYSTKVFLYPQAFTVLRFSQSASDLVSLKPHPNPLNVSFSATSAYPESVSVLVDGANFGLTPLSQIPILPGNHTFTFSSPGFVTREVTATGHPGKQLDLVVKLATDTKSPSPSLPTPPL
jgi:hypothetical protein